MPPRPRQKLTARLLDALKPGAVVRDSVVLGLYAERGLTDDSPVSLKIQADYRSGERTGEARERKTIKKAIGRYPGTSLETARAEAMRLLAEVRAGRDPRAKVVPAETWTVEHAFKAYLRDVAKRPGSELTQRDMTNRLARYLDDWRALPLASLTREMCEARQLKIQADVKARAASKRATGARAANATIRDLSSVWNYASDYTPLPPANPCRKIKFIGEKREHYEIPVAEIGAWWVAVGALKNPLRRAMHRLGLLSGLRPGNLTTIRKEWIDLDARRISFPASVMKGRRAFTLPLSGAMIGLVRDALAASEILERGSPWLFPSRSMAGVVQATLVTREKPPALLNRTGHALRHTYKSCARNARLPESQIMLLMAHRLGGMQDVYGSLAEQFDRLLADQETVSAYVLGRAGVTEVDP